MAQEREARILMREHRDDGVPRRLEREPLTVADLRAKSRERKVIVPWYVEAAKRARIARKYGREAYEMRCAMLGG